MGAGHEPGPRAVGLVLVALLGARGALAEPPSQRQPDAWLDSSDGDGDGAWSAWGIRVRNAASPAEADAVIDELTRAEVDARDAKCEGRWDDAAIAFEQAIAIVNRHRVDDEGAHDWGLGEWLARLAGSETGRDRLRSFLSRADLPSVRSSACGVVAELVSMTSFEMESLTGMGIDALATALTQRLDAHVASGRPFPLIESMDDAEGR